jgi:UDP-N-acetylmuramate dehydrogenase
MDADRIAKALSEKIEDVRIGESMAEHTSFKAGGPADVMALPKSVAEIKHALSIIYTNNCPLFVMGRGTNLLATSKGIRGVVLKIADNFSGVELGGEYVTAKSGTLLSVLIREAIGKSLGGAEFLGGIPGTLGGAVFMNAGAYGGEICEFIEEVYVLSGGEELTFKNKDMGFGYRSSILGEMPYIVTGAKLRLKACDAEDSRKRLSELNARRREKQPLEFPSAGSTFKRPSGCFAGALIEAAGLKGLKFGGAQVSEKHAGFIINTGGATPEDIIALIEEVRRRVKGHSGVTLEPEVRIVGER